MGVTLDYKKLLEPYRTPTEPGGPDRTPEGQRKWLVEKHRVPEVVAAQAMATVYAELAAGAVFETGYALDRHLLGACRDRLVAQTQALAAEAAKHWKLDVAAGVKAVRNARRPKNLARHPLTAARYYWPVLVSFAIGAGSVGAAWLASTL